MTQPSTDAGPVVVKLGGAVAADAAEHVLELAAQGPVCIVHGAGPQISALMAERGIPVRFIRGRRVTSRSGVDAVREALLAVNADLCSAIGPLATGLVGDEIGLRARRLPALGFVGDPLPSAPPAVVDAWAAGRIPVVAPIAEGPLNVNADDAAAQLAIGLGAVRMRFVSDVAGLLGPDGRVVEHIGADDADELLRSGSLEGGIIPKLTAAASAARARVRVVEVGATVVVP